MQHRSARSSRLLRTLDFEVRRGPTGGDVLDCHITSDPLVVRLRAVYARVTAESAQHRRLRVFCPIWRKPWMAFNADTYADNMLWCCGGENIFRGHPARYFSTTLEEVVRVTQ